jgi:hypothetical protein
LHQHKRIQSWKFNRIDEQKEIDRRKTFSIKERKKERADSNMQQQQQILAESQSECLK